MEASLLEQIPEVVREAVARVFKEREHFFSAREQHLQQQILLLRELVRLFHIEKFGASSEKLTDAQLALLNLEPSVTPEEVETEAALPEAEKAAVAEPPLQERRPAKKSGRKPRVRQAFAPELPRREPLIESAPGECRCKTCGGETRVIGYEESERLSVEPVRYFVEVTKREKRACPRCPHGGVSTAPMPAQIVEKGVFSNELVVDIIEKKYASHLPLYRQAQQIQRDCGYEPSRSTLSDCVLQAGASLHQVKEAMKADLLTGGYIQADETRVPVQVHTKEGVNHTGYFWQYSCQRSVKVYHLRSN